MYICKECGYVFEEPRTYYEDRTPGGAFEGGRFIEEIKGCPRCEGAYEEAIECDACGGYYLSEEITRVDNDNYCQECYNEIEGEDEWICN